MQNISPSLAKVILEQAYEELKQIDPEDMTTFELNLWRRLRDDKSKIPTRGCEDAILNRSEG